MLVWEDDESHGTTTITTTLHIYYLEALADATQVPG